MINQQVKSSLERTYNHARKGRALGLGVMGWHSFLQQKGLPFNSIASTAHTHNIFSDIRGKAEKASMALAQNMENHYGVEGQV